MADVELDLYGIPAALIARLVGVHQDTARRWKRAGRLPGAAAGLLALRLDGELGQLDPQWHGWRLVRGVLWSPEGVPVKPGDVLAIPYRRAQLRELELALSEPQQWQLFPQGIS